MFGFYDTSTLVGYLMPNPKYAYILNIYGFNYCDPALLILFDTNDLFAHSEVVTSIAFNTNYSIEPIHSFAHFLLSIAL